MFSLSFAVTLTDVRVFDFSCSPCFVWFHAASYFVVKISTRVNLSRRNCSFWGTVQYSFMNSDEMHMYYTLFVTVYGSYIRPIHSASVSNLHYYGLIYLFMGFLQRNIDVC